MIRSRVTAILIYEQALKPIVCCTPKFSREIFIMPLSQTLTLPIDAKKFLLTSPSSIEVSLILQIDNINKALTLIWLTFPYSLAMGWLKSFLKRRTQYITYLVTIDGLYFNGRCGSKFQRFEEACEQRQYIINVQIILSSKSAKICCPSRQFSRSFASFETNCQNVCNQQGSSSSSPLVSGFCTLSRL